MQQDTEPIATDLRLACLQAAAVFLAGRQEVKSTDVTAVAERFEAWVEGALS